MIDPHAASEPDERIAENAPTNLRKDLAVLLDRLYGLHLRRGHLDAVLDVVNLHAPVKVPIDASDLARRVQELEAERVDCIGRSELSANPADWGHKAMIEGLVGQREAAEARVQALEAEKAWMLSQRDVFLSERDNALRAKEAAEAEIARLRAALKEYGRHSLRCPASRSEPCKCGLDAVLSEAHREDKP